MNKPKKRKWKVKRIYKKKYINIHNTYSMISYNGWIVHSNYYNYYNKYIKPYVDIEVCKKIISLYDKNIDKRKKSAIIRMYWLTCQVLILTICVDNLYFGQEKYIYSSIPLGVYSFL